MIQGLFLGRTDFDRARKAGGPPAFVGEIVAAVRAALAATPALRDDLARAGFGTDGSSNPVPARSRAAAGYWFDEADDDSRTVVRLTLEKVEGAIAPWRANLSSDERRLADFAVIQETGYPGYLGGPFLFGERYRS